MSEIPSKRRRPAAQHAYTFGFASADVVTDANRKRSKLGRPNDLCDADDVESYVPESRAGLLKEMSAKSVGGENLQQSTFAFVVIRETELLLDKYHRTGDGDGVTTARDIERLKRRADDFALSNRAQIDTRHRNRLWVARCKLASLRAIMERKESVRNGGATASTSANVDSIRDATRYITDEMLATWMADNRIGSAAVVRLNPSSNRYEHSIDRCGLSELWALIKDARSRWPYLNLSPFLYALVNKLRDRVAFFMSYREPVDVRRESARKLRSVKILGIARSNWHAADPEWVEGGMYPGDGGGGGESEVVRDTSLINSPTMMTTIEIDGETFACVDNKFIEETERVLNSMLVDIRKCAGFEWHEHFELTEADCHACAQLQSGERAARQMAQAKQALERLIADELGGTYREFVQNNFREQIWDAYVQPGEREMFRAFRPLDNDTAQSIIQRSRRDDGKNIQRRFCEREVAAVWRDFTTSVERERDDVLLDYADRSEPACSLLARLVMGYYIDARANGAKFYVYCIDCADDIATPTRDADLSPHYPFLYNDERFGKHRRCFEEFHTPLQTTGTLRWRYKLQRTVGMRAPANQIYYEHPLIARTMASFCVLYNGRMHACANFEEAFIVWVVTMCEDANIGGELHTDYSLLDLYAQLFPARASHIADLRRTIDAQKRKWNPLERLFPHESLVEKPTIADDKLQF